MASTQIALTAKTWTQVTTTDKSGSIRHQSGNTAVSYTESTTEPAAFNSATPIMESTIKGEDFPYYGIGTSEFLWAYAVEDDAVITVSPGGI